MRAGSLAAVTKERRVEKPRLAIAERRAALIQNRAAGRLQDLAPETFDLADFLRDRASSLEGILGARGVLALDLPAEPIPVHLDPGKLEQAEECVLLLKSTVALAERLTEALTAAHSYDCPCVVSLPIESGNPAFLQWIEDETR